MWSGQHSVCIYLATTFSILSLPATLECCSLSTTEIIMLMSRNPNYESDPCYIQWQAVENAKLAQIWAQREKLEESIRESDRRQREYDARMQRMNRISTYSPSQATESKTGAGKVIGYLAIVGVIMGILCCIICVLAGKNDNGNGTTTTVPPTNLHRNESLICRTSTLPSNASGNNRTVFASTSSDNDSGGFESATFIPLKIPRRQDSLPSYEDAVKMSSPPLVQ